MALWLVRAGRHGEYEDRFLEQGRIYLTWTGLKHDLGVTQFDGKVVGDLIENPEFEIDVAESVAFLNRVIDLWPRVAEQLDAPPEPCSRVVRTENWLRARHEMHDGEVTVDGTAEEREARTGTK